MVQQSKRMPMTQFEVLIQSKTLMPLENLRRHLENDAIMQEVFSACSPTYLVLAWRDDEPC